MINFWYLDILNKVLKKNSISKKVAISKFQNNVSHPGQF
jgi:hypothetical protein